MITIISAGSCKFEGTQEAAKEISLWKYEECVKVNGKQFPSICFRSNVESNV